ncbi:hypothetical protein ACFQ60_45765 [Streptomyces zhihengii]
MHLNGRGLLLIPTYFCWNLPVALADPGLPGAGVPGAPRRAEPARRGAGPAVTARPHPGHRPAGRRGGVTTSEAARQAGVSTGTATHHTTALRDAGLISSRRCANTVLHTLTALGAALLRAQQRT